MKNIDFPCHFDSRGRTSETGLEDHVRDLIEQVLFTNPGERVNRPEFGCGLLQLVFAPNSDELAAATQVTVQASLQRWLADKIQVEAVDVKAVDSTLLVTVEYLIRPGQDRRVTLFEREVPA